MIPTTASEAHPASRDRPFDQGYTLQGVSILLGLVVAVLTILGTMRKTRRENEADARQRTDELKAEFARANVTIEDRLKAVETKIVDFMPRAEIEKAIEHEKTNRQQAILNVSGIAMAASRDVVEIKVTMGKLEQKHDGLASDMVEIKALLKENARDTASRLDRIQDSIARTAG